MDTTSYLALARQVTLQRHMATLATNIANATTSGYRAQHTVFEQVLQRAGDAGRVAFVQDVALARDLRPGLVEQTGNPLDVALDGSGYLSFATPAGTRYGRSGRLELDADGRLVGPEGHPVLDDSGNPITLPTDDLAITIGPDGTISGRSGPLARLGIVGFTHEQALERVGDGLLTATEAPVPAAFTRVVQGALEGSNVQPIVEMAAMLETVRAFEGTQKLLDTEHELERQAIERTIRNAA
jgi:flagellar basal-body rod protein FlgF